MAEGFIKIGPIEGTPHSAEISYQHDADGQPLTDFRIVIRPPIKASDHFWEIYGGIDSFTHITEEVSTPDFAYYEMTVDLRTLDGRDEHEPAEVRIDEGVGVIRELIENVNKISKGDLT